MKNVIEQTYGRILEHLSTQVPVLSLFDLKCIFIIPKFIPTFDKYFTYAKYVSSQKVSYQISRQSADHE